MREEFQPIVPILSLPQWASSLLPSFEMKETKDGCIVRGDLLGVREEDLDIAIEGNHVTIEGSRVLEERREGAQEHRFERVHAAFTRSFTLGDHVDGTRACAVFADGILTIAVPRRTERPAHAIPVHCGLQRHHLYAS